MKRPNFFIVGAPKCGTTALSEYLRDHPQIFMSRPKEPGYFCTDFHHWSTPWVRSERAYLRLFREAPADLPIVGEASAAYILSGVAIPSILEFAPEAKLLVMLRNPADLVYSLHNQLLWDLHEDVDDFRQAWGLQAERKLGKDIPSSCGAPEMLQYREVGQMAARVEALMARVDPDNLEVVLLDDFAQQTPEVYRSVLSFLGVPDDARHDFPKANVSKRIRPGLYWLARWNHRPPRVVRGMATLLKRFLGQRQRPLLSPVYRRESTRKPLDHDFRSELQEIFRDDVEALADLLGRDLSSWLT